jgi:hypothetical protein
MANRYFTQFFYSFFKKPVLIAGKIPLSAAAAVGTVAIKGVASVAKSGTGTYLVTLDDAYNELVAASVVVADSAQDLVVDLSTVASNGQTLTLVTKVAGTAADVSDACTIYLSLTLSNSSV